MATIEELETQVLELTDKNKELEAKCAEINSQNEELKKANSNLIEHNNKLFTRITAQNKQEENTSEMTPEEKFEDEVLNLLNKK